MNSLLTCLSDLCHGHDCATWLMQPTLWTGKQRNTAFLFEYQGWPGGKVHTAILHIHTHAPSPCPIVPHEPNVQDTLSVIWDKSTHTPLDRPVLWFPLVQIIRGCLQQGPSIRIEPVQLWHSVPDLLVGLGACPPPGHF